MIEQSPRSERENSTSKEPFGETIVLQATQFELGAELNANNNQPRPKTEIRDVESNGDGGGRGVVARGTRGVLATSGRFANN